MDRTTGKAGIIVAPEGGGHMSNLAHSVLDDVAYNVIFDLLLEVHQEEKTARAATAAIRVEKLASEGAENPVPGDRPEIRIETETAVYNSGEVYLKGNPLKTTKDILCPRCHLPRLLYPTDGKGARKPDPSIIYCKKHPYIDKPGFDIYGQTWVGPGPGRGKKKKEAADKRDGTESPAPSALLDKDTRPPNVLTFPSATCSKCKRCILVTRLNNHMGSCIGNSGRIASRAAAQKISGTGNGNGNGNGGNDVTPSSSQKGTPLPGSRAASPKKRDAADLDDLDDDEDDDTAGTPPPKKKKKLKATLLGAQAAATATATASPLTKKVILKAKGAAAAAAAKKDKSKPASALNQERRPGGAGVGAASTTASPKALVKSDLPGKKNTPKSVPATAASPAKKLKLSSKPPPALTSPLQSRQHKQIRDAEGDSESSGTLSSPPR